MIPGDHRIRAIVGIGHNLGDVHTLALGAQGVRQRSAAHERDRHEHRIRLSPHQFTVRAAGAYELTMMMASGSAASIWSTAAFTARVLRS